MEYSFYQLAWFFLVYAFAGWVFSTVVSAIRAKKFVDPGFLLGPYCPACGFAGVLFAVFLSDLKEDLFFLFLGGVVLSFLVGITAGFFLERIFHRKWWDFSKRRFQFGGYVILPLMILCGLAAVLCVVLWNPLLEDGISLVPSTLGKILLAVIYGMLAADLLATVTSLRALKIRLNKIDILENISENLEKATDTLGKGLAGWALKHVSHAYPNLETKKLLAARKEHEQQREKAREKAGVFAAGCSFYKLVWLFFLASFLGDIVETIFCYITMGSLMSRSSVVYGPFSVVWGFACVLLTAILHQYRDRSDSYIFAFGTILGGTYEYACSILSELVLGTVFWTYEHIPFNLGGRINLLFCFFWGIAAVVWLKVLYPFLSSFIEKIPKRIGILLTWILILFMTFNMLLSGLALMRYSERNTEHTPPGNRLEAMLDEHFPDSRMEKIYPKAIIIDQR